MVDAAPLLIGLVLGVGVSIGALALACLMVGLVGATLAEHLRPSAPPPVYLVARPAPTPPPPPPPWRPSLPVAPHRAALPRYVIPGTADVGAVTVGVPHDEDTGRGWTEVSEGTLVDVDRTEPHGRVIEVTAGGSTAWVPMPRPSWARGDRT